MPTTENDRRNQQKLDLQYPSVPQHRRKEGMTSAFPSMQTKHDLIEESELPAVEVSAGAGIQTRNSEETGDLNERAPLEGFILGEESDLNIPNIEVSSVDQDNNID